MKKTAYMLIVCVLVAMFVTSSIVQAATHDNDMRAVWISTVYNLDYPSTKNNITAQQNEFIEKLDTLQEMGINTVIVQVRPKADALYRSSINPWSDVLTGTQGKDPGYDPLAFMIEEAHSRGMDFHAWLNPYRVTTSGTDVSVLSSNHPARLNPSWLLNYNGKLYYNPESEGVKQHIVDTVREIATNYDVDGIHFDDYFYPSGYPLAAGETRDGVQANARRSAVNDMVRRVSTAVKNVNLTYGKSVKFGISPPGIWKNSSSDITGSNTSGNEAYYSVYADSRTWIQNGWLDYIVPQIYWKMGHSKADYETLVKWWSNEVSGTGVKLYIGQGVYSEEVAVEIDKQLALNKQYPLVKGSIFFSLRNLINDQKGCATKITAYYKSLGITSGTGNTTSGNINNGITNNNTNNIGSSSNNNSNVGTSTNSALSSNIGKQATVNASMLNIRSGARVDREIVTKVQKGTSVTILSTLGDWYKVRLSSGVVGWANATYLQVQQVSVSPDNTVTNSQTNTTTYPCQGTVTASSLNVRSGARVDRELITKLSQGTTVTVLSKLGDWYKIKMADQKIGWVNGAYIKLG